MPIASYDGQMPIIAPRDHRTRRYSESSSRRPIPLDDRPNNYKEIKPLSINSSLIQPQRKGEFTVDSRELYLTRNGKKHYPKDALYSQDALWEFERPPTPARIREAIIEIKPRMDENYNKHVKKDPRFKNRDSKPNYNAISLGSELALSTNTRLARHSRRDPDMDKHITILRPLASEVERYNSGRYEDTDGHTNNLRCGELASLDTLLRRPDRGRRARSETNGRDSSLRNKFRDRGSVSISRGAKDKWAPACDPFDDIRVMPGRTYGCTHVLDAYEGIEDNVRTQNRRRRKDPVVFDLSKDDTRERLELLDRGWY